MWGEREGEKDEGRWREADGVMISTIIMTPTMPGIYRSSVGSTPFSLQYLSTSLADPTGLTATTHSN